MPKRIVDSAFHEPVEPQIGYVDGYLFGERLLEGVMFAIMIDGPTQEVRCTGVAATQQDYMRKFSKAMIEQWKRLAEEAAEDSLTSLDGKRDLEIIEGE
jgi:hypothetical protein